MSRIGEKLESMAKQPGKVIQKCRRKLNDAVFNYGFKSKKEWVNCLTDIATMPIKIGLVAKQNPDTKIGSIRAYEKDAETGEFRIVIKEYKPRFAANFGLLAAHGEANSMNMSLGNTQGGSNTINFGTIDVKGGHRSANVNFGPTIRSIVELIAGIRLPRINLVKPSLENMVGINQEPEVELA